MKYEILLRRTDGVCLDQEPFDGTERRARARAAELVKKDSRADYAEVHRVVDGRIVAHVAERVVR
jgi:hypothetical protein